MNCQDDCPGTLIYTKYGFVCNVCQTSFINDSQANLLDIELDWEKYQAEWLARISKMGIKCDICEEKLAVVTHEPPVGVPCANAWYCNEHEENLPEKWQRIELIKQ